MIERNSQVLLMSKVYTQASAVFFWLGLHIGSEKYDWDDAKDWSLADQTMFRARLKAKKETKKTAQAAYETIKLLGLNSYWERTWIVQEVVLGQCVTLWYGAVGELSLEDFGWLYFFLVAFDQKWGPNFSLLHTSTKNLLSQREFIMQLLGFKYWRTTVKHLLLPIRAKLGP